MLLGMRRLAPCGLLLFSLLLAGCSHGGDDDGSGNGGSGGTPTPGMPTPATTPTSATTATPPTGATTPTSPTPATPTSPVPSGDPVMVSLVDDEFVPADLDVEAGTRAMFHNDGERSHTVTIHKVGDPPTTLLKDTVLGAGQETEFTFGEAATYHVWCRFHGTMTTGMAMVVEAA